MAETLAEALAETPGEALIPENHEIPEIPEIHDILYKSPKSQNCIEIHEIPEIPRKSPIYLKTHHFTIQQSRRKLSQRGQIGNSSSDKI